MILTSNSSHSLAMGKDAEGSDKIPPASRLRQRDASPSKPTRRLPTFFMHERFLFSSKAKSESDMEPESEEDDLNPYPIDGKYIDEADRARWGTRRQCGNPI